MSAYPKLVPVEVCADDLTDPVSQIISPSTPQCLVSPNCSAYWYHGIVTLHYGLNIKRLDPTGMLQFFFLLFRSKKIFCCWWGGCVAVLRIVCYWVSSSWSLQAPRLARRDARGTYCLLQGSRRSRAHPRFCSCDSVLKCLLARFNGKLQSLVFALNA